MKLVLILLLSVLTAAALLLRLDGIDYMLPHSTEPDAYVVAQAELHRPGTVAGAEAARPDQWDTFSTAYPHLVSWIVSAWPRAVWAAEPTAVPEQMERTGEPFAVARRSVAILGVLAVPGTFLLALHFMGAGWALLAAAFVATSLLHVNFSQQARPHVVGAMFALFAILAALRLRRSGQRLDYVMAALAATLAVGSLQTGPLVLLPLCAAHLLRASSWRRGLGGAMLLCAAIMLCAAILFYPQSLLDHVLEPSGRSKNLLLGVRSFDGSGFALVFRWLSSYDPVLVGLALVGLAAANFEGTLDGLEKGESGLDLIVVMTYVAAYVVLFGMYSGTSARFLIQLLPFAACLAALGARGLARLVSVRAGPRIRSATAVTVSLAALALPSFASYKLVELRAAPDTYMLAAEWIRANVDRSRDRIMLTPGFDLPLEQDAASLDANRPWGLGFLKAPWFTYQSTARRAPERQGYQVRFMPYGDKAFMRRFEQSPAPLLREHGIDYVVLGEFSQGPLTAREFRWRRSLRASGTCVATLAPFTQAPSRALLYQQVWDADSGFMRSVLESSRVGPVLQIYAIGRPKPGASKKRGTKRSE